jgi:hypothetical protein
VLPVLKNAAWYLSILSAWDIYRSSSSHRFHPRLTGLSECIQELWIISLLIYLSQKNNKALLKWKWYLILSAITYLESHTDTCQMPYCTRRIGVRFLPLGTFTTSPPPSSLLPLQCGLTSNLWKYLMDREREWERLLFWQTGVPLPMLTLWGIPWPYADVTLAQGQPQLQPCSGPPAPGLQPQASCSRPWAQKQDSGSSWGPVTLNDSMNSPSHLEHIAWL